MWERGKSSSQCKGTRNSLHHTLKAKNTTQQHIRRSRHEGENDTHPPTGRWKDGEMEAMVALAFSFSLSCFYHGFGKERKVHLSMNVKCSTINLQWREMGGGRRKNVKIGKAVEKEGNSSIKSREKEKRDEKCPARSKMTIRLGHTQIRNGYPLAREREREKLERVRGQKAWSYSLLLRTFFFSWW